MARGFRRTGRNSSPVRRPVGELRTRREDSGLVLDPGGTGRRSATKMSRSGALRAGGREDREEFRRRSAGANGGAGGAPATSRESGGGPPGRAGRAARPFSILAGAGHDSAAATSGRRRDSRAARREREFSGDRERRSSPAVSIPVPGRGGRCPGRWRGRTGGRLQLSARPPGGRRTPGVAGRTARQFRRVDGEVRRGTASLARSRWRLGVGLRRQRGAGRPRDRDRKRGRGAGPGGVSSGSRASGRCRGGWRGLPGGRGPTRGPPCPSGNTRTLRPSRG